MKEFKLEAAKAGEPVMTKAGKSARIICFDRKDSLYPLLALVESNDTGEERIFSYTEKGEYTEGDPSSLDLVMKPEIRSGWVNIYKREGSVRRRTGTQIYHTKEEAVDHRDISDSCTTTIKIEWEE